MPGENNSNNVVLSMMIMLNPISFACRDSLPIDLWKMHDVFFRRMTRNGPPAQVPDKQHNKRLFVGRCSFGLNCWWAVQCLHNTLKGGFWIV